MTFGDYILALRERLQDLRDLNGAVISVGSGNGVRWTATQLYKIANDSLAKAIRLMYTYSNSPLLQQLGVDYFIASGTATTSGTTGISSAILPDSVLMITSLKDSAGNNYAYTLPSKFFIYENADNTPRSGEYFFTLLFDTAANGRKIHILPRGNAVSLTYTYIFRKSDYVVVDLNTQLAIRGMDDFILDVAEMECRRREGNREAINELLQSIKLTLGVTNE
jgi:hypothetical protein